MRIAHCADLHLGFRQFHRSTSGGINQREVDVALAVRRAVDAIIAARVELVLIAGDVFHQVRPTNPAILEADRQLRRLRAGLPDAPIVVIAGNHDSPKNVETGSILPLFRAIDGVTVAWQDVQTLRVGDCLVTAVPHLALLEAQSFAPDPDVPHNVLCIHGATPGLAGGSGVTGPAADVDWSTAADSPWSYIALGDYHVAHAVRPNAWYSGSLECVSTNPWGELRERPAKGWLLVELTDGPPIVTFQPVATRPFRDLPPADVATAEALNARLHALTPDDVAGQVVRLVVPALPRSERAAIDHEHVRALKAAALDFRLDLRSATRTVDQRVAAGLDRRLSLDELVAQALDRRCATWAPEQAARMHELADAYLHEADAPAEALP